VNSDKQFTIQEIADKIDGEIVKNTNSLIFGVASLQEAEENEISFLGNKKYSHQVASSHASVVIVGKDFKISEAGNTSLIICDTPNLAFAKAIELFAPQPIVYKPEIHPCAVIAESAIIGENTHIGPCAVIGENTIIGSNSVIDAGTVIGNEVKVGDNVLIYSNVSIRERCIVGNRIIIHPGTVIGSDGFGFEAGPAGIIKIPQVGIVQIDDDVEIGSNCSIDRARFGKTWIKMGVKIDNQVHIAHNVEVGEFSMLIGQSGIAGSTKIGQGVIVAAKAGINGHINIGDGSRIAGTAGVVKDVPPGATVVGTPAEPKRDFMARMLLPKTVSKLKDKVRELEKKIAAIENHG